VLHSGEGAIQSVRWTSSLIAWANAVSVKVTKEMLARLPAAHCAGPAASSPGSTLSGESGDAGEWNGYAQAMQKEAGERAAGLHSSQGAIDAHLLTPDVSDWVFVSCGNTIHVPSLGTPVHLHKYSTHSCCGLSP